MKELWESIWNAPKDEVIHFIREIAQYAGIGMIVAVIISAIIIWKF